MIRIALASGALALILAGCATSGPPDAPGPDHSGPGERHRDHGDQGPGFGGGRPGLFISPSGEPFRSRPGEPYPVDRWFAQDDRNHDGKVDRAEFRADAAAFFQQLDQNQDGVVDSFEVQRYEREIVPEILGAYSGGSPRAGQSSAPPSGGGGGGGGGGGRHGGGRRGQSGGGAQSDGDGGGVGEVLEGAAAFELINEPEPVQTADTQFNGRITLKQFLDTADRHFDLLDKTGRGYLTLIDLPKTPIQQQMSPGRHGYPNKSSDN